MSRWIDLDRQRRDLVGWLAEGLIADNIALRGWVMSWLVEFPLQEGGTILVRADEAAAGPVTRGLGDRRVVSERSQQAFGQAIARVQPAAHALISRLRALADAPDQVGVSIGLELSAEAGTFIAAASSTANFKVTLRWRRNSWPTTAASADVAEGS